jgi:hypothetical protein
MITSLPPPEHLYFLTYSIISLILEINSSISSTLRYIRELYEPSNSFVSTIIPGESDDKIVDVISKLAQEPWVIPAITFLINKFDNTKPITSEDFLLAIKVAKNEA